MTTLPQPLARPKFVSLTLEFQDADASKSKPLPHARVLVELLDADNKPSATLFQGRANARGQVSLRVPAPPSDAGKKPGPLPNIRVSVLDLDGVPLKEQDVSFEADKPIAPIKVSDKPQKEKIRAPFGDGTAVLGQPLSAKLSKLLTDHKVDSLTSLRSAGPLAKLLAPDSPAFAALSKKDRQDWADLNAHAQLQLVSRDHKTNRALIKAGYHSVLEIAGKSRSEFMTKMIEVKISPAESEKLYTTARRQMLVLSNMYTEQQVALANRMQLPTSSTGGRI